jgi:hypothetical protein
MNFDADGALSFDLKHQTAYWHILDGIVICTYGIEVVLNSQSRGIKNRIAQLSLVFRSEYLLLPSFESGTDAELLQHYVGIVGRMHCWPYFRQEVQALTTKLGFPPLTLPVLVSGHMVHLPTAKWIDPTPKLPKAPRKTKAVQQVAKKTARPIAKKATTRAVRRNAKKA